MRQIYRRYKEKEKRIKFGECKVLQNENESLVSNDAYYYH